MFARPHLPQMTPDRDPLRLTGRRRGFRLQLGGPLGTLAGFAAGAVGLVLALAFSLVLFTVLLAAGVVFGGWFWWKTRALRKQLATAHASAHPPHEREVQGEAVIITPADAPSRDSR
jgi:threonine/homoserine/homoserine lactone efflux protein